VCGVCVCAVLVNVHCEFICVYAYLFLIYVVSCLFDVNCWHCVHGLLLCAVCLLLLFVYEIVWFGCVMLVCAF